MSLPEFHDQGINSGNLEYIKQRLLKAINQFDAQFDFAHEEVKPDGTAMLVGPPGTFVALFDGQIGNQIGLCISVNADPSIIAGVLVRITQAFNNCVRIISPMIEVNNPDGISFTSDLDEVYKLRQEYILLEAQRIILQRGEALHKQVEQGGTIFVPNPPANAAQALRQSIGAEPKIVIAKQ